MLVDTSVWVDHLRRALPALVTLLGQDAVECHPFVIGELACGSMHRRGEVLALLQKLPQVTVASHDEVLAFVDRHALMSRGIGWIDAHLLASAALSKTKLWSHDRRLADAARLVHLFAQP